MKKIALIFLAAASLLSPANAANSEKLPTCAVVLFDAAGDATESAAGKFADLVSVNIARSGKYRIIPRYQVKRALARRRFKPSAYSSHAAAARTAGGVLKADLVIFGSLSSKGGQNEAFAGLIDVKAGVILDRVQIAASATPESFRRTAAAQIARKLSGTPEAVETDRHLARIEPPPRQPEPERPKPVLPAKRIETPREVKPEPVKPVVVAPAERPAVAVTEKPGYTRSPISDYINAKANSASVYIQRNWERFRKASAGSLDAGIRYRTLSLNTEEDESLLGTINELDLENDGIPAELFATWYFNEYIGAEISWFNLRAKTVSNPEAFSDGAICISGPTFAIAGKYEDYAPWIPFASAGLGFFSAEFDGQTWWHYGYESVADWQNQGSPSYSITGKIRRLDFDNTIGKFIVLGMSYRPNNSRWSAELAYRAMSLSADSRYYIESPDAVRDRGSNKWPLDNKSWLIGARYSF